MTVNVMTIRQNVLLLRQSRFIRNVGIVATGFLAAQIISLAFSPFLTRLYGPEAFGVLAAFIAIQNILSPASTFGYSTAIVLPTDDQGATAVARLSTFCALALTPVFFVIIWLFEAPLAALANLEDHSDLLYLLPLSTLLGALLSVAEQMAIRETLFKVRAVSKIISTLVNNAGKLAVGFLTPSGIVLIAMTIAGVGINFTLLLARAPHQGGFRLREWFGTKDIWAVARTYRDFPFYRLPQSVINALAMGLPVLLLTALFGAATAGQYSLTSLVLGAPVLLLGKSVLDVFYPKITREIEQDKRRAAALLRKATGLSALLGIAVFVPLAFLSPLLFPAIFGGEWVQAGLFAQWVCLWMAGVIVSRPAVATYPALGLQKHLLAYETLVTCARVAALYFGAQYYNDIVSVAAFSVVNLIGYLFLTGLAYMRMRNT